MKIIRLFSFLIFFWVLLGVTALADTDAVTVRFVIDGDTVVLADGRHLRYIGIDAPEIAHEGSAAEPFADAAKALNEHLVKGRAVVLIFDWQHRDRYGRLLAHVRTREGAWVAETLLAAGMAHVRIQAPNLSRSQELLAVQRMAMEAGAGKWQDLKKVVGKVLGNRATFRFHRMDCRFSRKTALKNRFVFSNQYDAFYAGFAPCRICFGAGQTTFR